MNVSLKVVKGNTRTRTVQIRSKRTVIGRDHSCGVRIPSANISRRHCLLKLEHGYLTVVDLRSKNGTFVNGAPVRYECIVRPGDRLGIGPVEFEADYVLTPAACKRLEAAAGKSVVDELEVVEDEVSEDDEVLDILSDDDILDIEVRDSQFRPRPGSGGA